MSIDFRETWLWRRAFIDLRSDANVAEQKYFELQYLSLREKAAALVSCIAADVPGLTIHDITHLDALWDMASLLTQQSFDLSPPEAFVLGAAFLLHDAGMTLAAYPNGALDLEKTIIWKDMSATALKNNPDLDPKVYRKELIGEVLRRLHAEKAAELPLQPFYLKNGTSIFLIEDTDLRSFYGPSIGVIAYSHWWPIGRLESELRPGLGAYPPKTRSSVNKIKIAALLRAADAIHLDKRRAPSFSRALAAPSGKSKAHWDFQEKFASPTIEDGAVVFTASQPFNLEEADAWWIAYDAICTADRELRDVDLLLREESDLTICANRVKGAISPDHFSKIVQTKNWKPVESKIHISDVPKIVEVFGGAKLYGDDPMVAVRELIQNARDAIDGRRRRQGRPLDWGLINVSIIERDGVQWLSVEDNGLGMSETVLTNSLIDFGSSLWSSPELNEEFPGLAAAGIRPVGRFGIGFFSVFMLGHVVRVITRRYDKGDKDALVLEFRNGLNSRPILYVSEGSQAPVDGGTKVEVLLQLPEKLVNYKKQDEYGRRLSTFPEAVAALAPMLDVSISVQSKPVVKANDWLRISAKSLFNRFLPFLGFEKSDVLNIAEKAIRPVRNINNVVIGRACIYPSSSYYMRGIVTLGGLSASAAQNIIGVVEGEPSTVARDEATLLAKRIDLRSWATDQAGIFKRMRLEPQIQANIAEVVLECGGDLSGLKIMRVGANWKTARQLLAYLKTINSFEARFGHIRHEDDDSVTVREFEARFEVAKNLFFVPEYDGRIKSFKRKDYAFTYEPPARRLENFFDSLVVRAWGGFSPEECQVTVGKVGYEGIVRAGYRYQRLSE